jgi:hypothetical protein
MVLLPTLVLLLASCHGEHAESTSAATSPAPSTAPSAARAASPAAATRKPVDIKRADGSPYLTVSESDGAVRITYTDKGQQHVLSGDPRDSGKRKYTLDGGPVIYEIKPGDDQGFKLRLPDGSLRWKVKVTAEKIKVSDNNENDRPFELKLRDAGRVKVVAPGERELGNVRVNGTKIEVENAAGTKLFAIDGTTPSAAYGVLLLEDIDQTQRAILLAELLSRGR